jgi:hypothetical protein
MSPFLHDGGTLDSIFTTQASIVISIYVVTSRTFGTSKWLFPF